MKAVDIARRTFLLGATAIAGGLAVGYFVTKPSRNPLEQELKPDEVAFAPYVKIGHGNEITIIVPRTEMGQGVHTTLAAYVAEELDVSLDQIKVEDGPVDSTYYNTAVVEELVPFIDFDQGMLAGAARALKAPAGKLLGIQITAGSTSARDGFERMRYAGAVLRAMLVAAAADEWNADARTFITENGTVIDPTSDYSATYGQLSKKAARQNVPASVSLKPQSQWKILGKSQPRVDFSEKVTGTAIYGTDLNLPEMLHGTVRLGPGTESLPTRVDEAAALNVPGVVKIVPIYLPHGTGYGVIATGQYAAFKGAEALAAEWDVPIDPADSTRMNAELKKKLKEPADFVLREEGNTALFFADAPRREIVEAQYSVPFLAHACMEPINAAARVNNGFVEIWTASQAPTILRSL
ncbi:MAG: molybdopterin cofactor-binding domain-containing protein, partial [Pseudomonadota bacterium]